MANRRSEVPGSWWLMAAGISWKTIAEEWRGSVSSDAISEAVRLATQAFRDHSGQYAAPERAPERVTG